MAAKTVVGGSTVSANQLKDLFRQIEDGSLSGYHIQGLLEHRNPFEIPMDTEAQLERTCVFFAAIGIIIDPATVVIPERKPGIDRLIINPKGMTHGQLVAYLRTQFDVSLYIDDLDKDVSNNDRTNDKTYAIWVLDSVEADEELKNLSADDLKGKGIPGITLMERLIYEGLYFSETGKHLDVQNVTLCSGSRRSAGVVPRVDWRAGRRRLCVRCHAADSRCYHLRARAVVSLSDAV